MPQEDTQEVRLPPRYLWLKRLLLAGGLVLVGVLGVRLVAGRVAAGRLAALQQDLEVQLAALAVPGSIAEEDNAATHFLAAAELLEGSGWVSPLLDVADGLSYVEIQDESRALALHIIEVNQPALDRIAAARSCRHVAWPALDQQGSIRASNKQTPLAKLLAVDARVALLRGDARHAALRVADLQMLARRDNTGGPVRWLGTRATLECRRIIEDWLRTGAAPVDAETRTAMQLAIAELLDSRALRQAEARSLLADVLHGSRLERGGFLGPWRVPPLIDQFGWPTNPVLVSDVRVWLAMQISATQGLSAATYDRSTGGVYESDSLLRKVARPISLEFGSSSEMWVRACHRLYALRRCMAASLASVLYRADHQAWPREWSDLVPRYLPAVPRDPFGDGEQALLLRVTSDGLVVTSRNRRAQIVGHPPEPIPWTDVPARIRAKYANLAAWGAP